MRFETDSQAQGLRKAETGCEREEWSGDENPELKFSESPSGKELSRLNRM